ncbi:hypothetical protein NQZ68_009255 [Dissostichus eleginoides]|nr:hypothetical protein NQZ68_009255 [Dissostichus eleginoides]
MLGHFGLGFCGLGCMPQGWLHRGNQSPLSSASIHKSSAASALSGEMSCDWNYTSVQRDRKPFGKVGPRQQTADFQTSIGSGKSPGPPNLWHCRGLCADTMCPKQT